MSMAADIRCIMPLTDTCRSTVSESFGANHAQGVQKLIQGALQRLHGDIGSSVDFKIMSATR